MAETVHTAHLAGGHPVVLVVGRFRVEFDGGLRQRLSDLGPDLAVLTLAVLAEDAEALREEDEGRADVVIYAGSFPDD